MVDNVGEGFRAAPIQVTIERVPLDAPWAWLAAGWRDLWSAPRMSLLYGAVFATVAVCLTGGLMFTGYESLILALAGGFLLVGPVAAIGLYETSRRLETPQPLQPASILLAGLRAPGQLGFFGAILAFLYVLWVQIAFLLFMLFMGGQALPSADQFVPTLLFTPRGLGLLVAGTATGAVLAFLVFGISVIAPPLLMTRQIDAVSAMRASLMAVAMNPKPMLLWASLIAGFMALGIATLSIGLIVIFPLIGHATWHAFRDLVREPQHYFL